VPLEGDELAAWLAHRAGKLTASRMADAMDFRKDGKPGAARVKLMHELLAERMTGDSVRHFVTDAMAWGLEKEAEAKAEYEAATGVLLGEAGFYDHPRIDMFGATPDALIGRDGLAEFKAPTSTTYVEWRMAGVVPEQHKPQMTAQLVCAGREWCEFVAYDPRVRDPRHRLFIRRFTPTADERAAVEKAAETFLAEVDRMWEVLTTAAA
jgi:predicted phage-related endonuclease